MRFLALALALAFALALAPLATVPDDGLDGRRETPHLILLYRRGAEAEAFIDWVAREQEAAWQRVASTLGMEYPGRIRVHVYEDEADLQARTGVAGVGGYAGDGEVHCTVDLPPTHEMAHVFARVWASGEDGPGAPDPFFEEGLAEAVAGLGADRVDVDVRAAWYLGRGLLPPLAELRGRFREAAVAPPEARPVEPYAVAGSFLRHLFRVHGAERVRGLYRTPPPAEALSEDEAAWRACLAMVEVTAGARRFLERRERTGVLSRSAGDHDHGPWVALEGPWRMDLESCWEAGADGNDLRGHHDGPFTAAHAPGGPWGDLVLAAEVETEGAAVSLSTQLGPEGRGNHAILAPWGVFWQRDEEGGALANREAILTPGRPHAVLLVVRDGDGLLFLDGLLVLEARRYLGREPGGLAVRVEGGSARVRGLRIRPL